MKLLFIVHDTEKSGAPRVTVELARALAARGHQVTLCFPRRGEIEEEARAAGLRIVIVPNPPVSLAAARGADKLRLAAARVRALWGYWQLARAARWDAVWVGSSVAVIGGTAAWLARRPVVYHVHEDVVASRINRARVRLVKRTARALVFVARKSMAAFEPRPSAQQWHVLPNFIDPRKFEGLARDEALRENLGAEPGDIVFLTAAFITPRKGIDVLVDAFHDAISRHPNASLWIAGAEVEAHHGYRRDVARRVVNHGLSERVHFLGHREDVPRLMMSADVYVLASRNEALPLTIAEAMAAGLPVVATDVGSVRDMVVEGETGRVVPPEDAQALAEAMGAYAQDAELRRAHGAAGQARARELYEPEAICRQTEEILGRMKAEG